MQLDALQPAHRLSIGALSILACTQQPLGAITIAYAMRICSTKSQGRVHRRRCRRRRRHFLLLHFPPHLRRPPHHRQSPYVQTVLSIEQQPRSHATSICVQTSMSFWIHAPTATHKTRRWRFSQAGQTHLLLIPIRRVHRFRMVL